jgi:hypothetical protein
MSTRLVFIIIFAGFVNVTMFAASSHSLTKEQENVYWKALRYYQEENYTKSLLIFEYLADQIPENDEFNYYVGMCFFHLNRPKLAKWYFAKVSEDNYSQLKILLLTRIQGYANNGSDF